MAGKFTKGLHRGYKGALQKQTSFIANSSSPLLQKQAFLKMRKACFFVMLNQDSGEALSGQVDAQRQQDNSSPGLGTGLQSLGSRSKQECGSGEHTAAHKSVLPKIVDTGKAGHQRQNAKVQHTKQGGDPITAGIALRQEMLDQQCDDTQQHHIGNVQRRDNGGRLPHPNQQTCGQCHKQYCRQQDVQ